MQHKLLEMVLDHQNLKSSKTSETRHFVPRLVFQMLGFTFSGSNHPLGQHRLTSLRRKRFGTVPLGSSERDPLSPM